eukprot:evm.model.NODE_47055_length_21649_cov_25.785116.1
MQGDTEDPDEASALLAQAALFPPGSLQRRFTLHYWRHAGIDAQKEPQAREDTPKEGQEWHERPRGLHQYLYHHPNGLFIVGLGKTPRRPGSDAPPTPHPLTLPTSPSHSTPDTAKDNAVLQACRQDNITIASVEFLPDNKPSGEGKRGVGGGDAGAAPEATTAKATSAEGTSAIMKRARITSRGRGKKQKGSLQVKRDTVVARVVLSDGREFPVF